MLPTLHSTSRAVLVAVVAVTALVASGCMGGGGGGGGAASPSPGGISIADIVGGGGGSPSPGGGANVGPGEVVVVSGTVDRVLNEHAFVLAAPDGNATVLVLWDGETADIINQDATVEVSGTVDTFSVGDLAAYEQQFAGSGTATPSPANAAQAFTEELFAPFDQQPFVAAETVELRSVQQD